MNRLRLVLAATLTFIYFQAFAFSDFRTHTKNENLASQIKGDLRRKQDPSGPVRWLVDFEIFKQWGSLEYYHGPGYWIDGFAEYSPIEDLTINTQLILENGSTSYGYNDTSSSIFMPSIHWFPTFWGHQEVWAIRFFDLGRRTIGTGLLIEDEEMSGMMTSFHLNSWTLEFLFPGTSIINESGDLLSSELSFNSDYFRWGGTFFFFFNLVSFDSKTNLRSQDEGFSESLQSVFGSFDDGVSRGELEIGHRAGGLATRAQYEWRKQDDKNLFKIQLTARQLSEKYLAPFSSSYTSAYRPYSIMERLYNHPRIFLSKKYPGGDIQAVSAESQIRHWIRSHYFLELRAELGRFQFANSMSAPYSWGKVSWGYTPEPSQPGNQISLYVKNYGVTIIQPNADYLEALEKTSGLNIGIESSFGF